MAVKRFFAHDLSLRCVNVEFCQARLSHDLAYAVRAETGEILGLYMMRLVGEAAEVDPLAVASALRRQGFGRALFHHAVRIARYFGAAQLVAWATEGVAIEFYEKMGAHPDGWRDVANPGRVRVRRPLKAGLPSMDGRPQSGSRTG